MAEEGPLIVTVGWTAVTVTLTGGTAAYVPSLSMADAMIEYGPALAKTWLTLLGLPLIDWVPVLSPQLMLQPVMGWLAGSPVADNWRVYVAPGCGSGVGALSVSPETICMLCESPPKMRPSTMPLSTEMGPLGSRKTPRTVA